MNILDFVNKLKLTSGAAMGSFTKEVKKDNNLLDYIYKKTSFLNYDAPISHRFFYLKNELSEQVTCKMCGTALTQPLHNFCSKRCSGFYIGSDPNSAKLKSNSLSKNYANKTDEEKLKIKEKRKQTNLDRYGVENNMYIEGVREKTKEHWLNEYGYDNPNKNDNVKIKISIKNRINSYNALEKRIKTNLDKYGVTNVMYVESTVNKLKQTISLRTVDENNDILNKIKTTNLIKYNTTVPQSLPEIKNKTKNTCIEKYGVGCVFQSESIKEKIKKTCIDKYGVEYWLQHPDSRKNYSPKNYTSLNKKFENILITYFNNISYKTEYFLKNDNKSTFFDFYLTDYNLLIELNGDYWHMNPTIYEEDKIFMKGTTKQMLAKDVWLKDASKIQNAKNLGYDVLIIWEKDFDENIIIEIIKNKINNGKN